MAHIYVQCKRTLTRNRYHREMLRPSVFASPKVCSDLLTCVTTSVVSLYASNSAEAWSFPPLFFFSQIHPAYPAQPLLRCLPYAGSVAGTLLAGEERIPAEAALASAAAAARSQEQTRHGEATAPPRTEQAAEPGSPWPGACPRPWVPRCRPRTRWRRRPKHKLQAKRASLGPPPPTQAEQRVAGVEAGVLTKPRTAS